MSFARAASMRWSGLLRVSCSLCGPRHRGLEYALSRAAAAELPAATERLPAAWDVRSTRGAEVLPSRGIDASKFARGAPLCARATLDRPATPAHELHREMETQPTLEISH